MKAHEELRALLLDWDRGEPRDWHRANSLIVRVANLETEGPEQGPQGARVDPTGGGKVVITNQGAPNPESPEAKRTRYFKNLVQQHGAPPPAQGAPACLHCGSAEHETGEHIKATLIEAARDRVAQGAPRANANHCDHASRKLYSVVVCRDCGSELGREAR